MVLFEGLDKMISERRVKGKIERDMENVLDRIYSAGARAVNYVSQKARKIKSPILPYGEWGIVPKGIVKISVAAGIIASTPYVVRFAQESARASQREGISKVENISPENYPPLILQSVDESGNPTTQPSTQPYYESNGDTIVVETPGKLENIVDETAGENVSQVLSAKIQNEQPRKNRKINYKVDERTVYKLADAVFGEGSVCSFTERVAIAYTAVNYVKSPEGKRHTLAGELNKGRYNGLRNPIDHNSKTYRECLMVARGVLEGGFSDPTNGATHMNLHGYTKPYWADSFQNIGRIETEKGLSAHDFYRPKKN